MVQLFLNKNKIGVKICGPNFGILKNVLKENYFTFSKEGLDGTFADSMWIHAVDNSVKETLDRLYKIEPFVIPTEVEDALNPKPETEYFRAKISPDLLAFPPLGDYQTRAITQGIQQSRCYFAHKQGLGKTYIAFSVLNHLYHFSYVDKALILCRPEGVYNLRRELLKFNTFNLKEEEIYVADAKHRDPFTDSIKVVICTYRTFLLLCDDQYKKDHKGAKVSKWRKAPIDFSKWGTNRVLFCDESHSVKNRTSRWTRAVDLESVFFRFRYMMSGTPYPRGIEDIWEQLHILDPNIVGKDYYSFLGDIAVLGTRFSEYEIRYYKEEKIKDFLESVKPWLIREFSEENLDLPEQIEEKVYIRMSEKQKAIYKEFVSYRLATIKDRGTDSAHFMREVYRDFPRIQLAVTDPCMLLGRIDPDVNPSLFKKIKNYKFEDSTRVEICDSLVENILDKGKKVLIWSGHPMVIQNLGEHYQKYHPFLIHGEVDVPRNMSKDAYIDSIIEEFKYSSDRNILIASYNMISTSKNIQQVQTMIFYDRPWDFSVLDQAKERNHRPGSEHENLLIYYLIAEHTLEEKQDRVLAKRKNLDKEALKYDSLDKDSWRQIFEGEEVYE